MVGPWNSGLKNGQEHAWKVWDLGKWVVMKETLTGQAAGSPALPEGICTRTKLQRLSNWRDSVAWRQLFIPKRKRKVFCF